MAALAVTMHGGENISAVFCFESMIKDIIICPAELQEIVQGVDGEADLKTFFKEKIHRAKTDRNPFYKVVFRHNARKNSMLAVAANPTSLPVRRHI